MQRTEENPFVCQRSLSRRISDKIYSYCSSPRSGRTIFITSFVILILAVLALFIYPMFLKTRGSNVPSIDIIDGITPVAGNFHGITVSPSFSGTAGAGLATSVYEQPVGALGPTFDKAVGEGDLSIPYDPGGAPFSDDFSSGNRNKWSNVEMGGNSTATVIGEELKTESSVNHSTNTLASKYPIIMPVSGNFFLEGQVRIGAISGDDSFEIGLRSSLSAPDTFVTAEIMVFNNGNIYRECGAVNSGVSENIPLSVGQTIRLRMEGNGDQLITRIDTNNDGVYEFNSTALTCTHLGESNRIFLNNKNWADADTQLFWDNFSSDLIIAPTYTLGRTAMNFGGNDYKDSVPFDPTNPPGILFWKDLSENSTILPDIILFEAHSHDIYVYLTTLFMPPATTLRWTVYSYEPATFAGVVTGLNGFLPPGGTFVVDAFAKAFHPTGATDFDISTLPLHSEGSMDASGAVIPVVSASPTLIAQTTSDLFGNWNATFGQGVPALAGQNLTNLHAGPYHFFVKTTPPDSLSSTVSADIAAAPPIFPPAYTSTPPEENGETTEPPAEEIGEEITPPPVCSNTLAEIQATPIPPFPDYFGIDYPWGDRVRWALDHRANIYHLYVDYLRRQPCATEVNWILQHDNDIFNIRYNILISEEYKLLTEGKLGR
jgi:hypothetical protein